MSHAVPTLQCIPLVIQYTTLVIFKGNLKQYLRLTTAAWPLLPVLGIKKALIEKAGVPDLARVLRDNGYTAMDSKNTRYVMMLTQSDQLLYRLSF